jgi:basic membrane protein A and related proteins
MNWKKLWATVLCVALIAGLFAGCAEQETDKLKVGVIYISPKNDGGWSEAHATGFQQALTNIGADKIELQELENIDDGDAAVTETSIRQLIESGCEIIFATSYGYMDTVELLAGEYPNIKFEHCSGTKSNDTNFDNYFGQIEQPRYLTGIMAGYATQTNKIGYVAAFPFAEVIRGINAFTLGVRSVNPDAEVHVEWTMSWFNPDKEKENAIALLNKGCDVMSQHQDSPAALTAAEDAGVYGFGYDNPMGQHAPNGYLSAPIFRWGAYYEKKIQAMLDDAWGVENEWGGLKEGIVAIDEMSDKVSSEAKQKVTEIKALLMEQDNEYFFTGPLNDNKGNVAVETGTTLTREDQYSMNWFVEGVVGEIPD